MAVQFFDSCGDYYDSGDLDRVFTSFSNALVEPTNGRRGGACIELDGLFDNFSVGLPGSETKIIGWAGRFGGLGAVTTNPYMQMGGDGVTHCTMTIHSDGTIYIKRGSQSGTIVAQSSSGVITTGTYFYIEWKLKIGDSTDGLTVVRVDGVEVINQTDIDTNNIAPGAADNVHFIFARSPSIADGHKIDDLYISDLSGGAPQNDFLGDIQVDTVFPDGAGATSDFDTTVGSANHFENVDENPADDDTSYNETATDNDVDLFEYAALPSIIGGALVLSVKATILAKKTDAGISQMRAVARPLSTNRVGAAMFIGTDYQYFSEIWDLNPETSGAWTDATVNASEFGVEKLP